MGLALGLGFKRAARAAAALCCLGVGAQAEGVSHYTKVNLKGCALLSAAPEGDGAGGAAFRCSGHRGVDLFISEGDLRFNVDVGAPDDGWISVGPFNTLGDTVEWRYDENDVELKAIIIRYRYDGGDPTPPSELAVITPARPDQASCYLAFVKATARPSQNVAARRVADAAEGLPCIAGRPY